MKEKRMLIVEVSSCNTCPMLIEDHGNHLCKLAKEWLDTKDVLNSKFDKVCPLEKVKSL